MRDEGFEVGIHTWDHVKWQDGVADAGEEWTSWQMALARQRFLEIFGEEPAVHGAAGWQMNVHAYRRTQSLGFRYASDTRGTHPFIPVIRAEIVACPQLPTTLPTMDEMIGLDGVTEDNVADALLRRTANPQDHVYTLHAELEGMKLAPAFEKLLAGWILQGYELVALRELLTGVELTSRRCIRSSTPRSRDDRVAIDAGSAFLPGDESMTSRGSESFSAKRRAVLSSPIRPSVRNTLGHPLGRG